MTRGHPRLARAALGAHGLGAGPRLVLRESVCTPRALRSARSAEQFGRRQAALRCSAVSPVRYLAWAVKSGRVVAIGKKAAGLLVDALRDVTPRADVLLAPSRRGNDPAPDQHLSPVRRLANKTANFLQAV